MTYTLRLLGLECLQAQEFDGDEAYLTLDGVSIWEASSIKMSADLSKKASVSQVDFVEGRALTAEGWTALPDFKPQNAVLSGLSGQVMVQLWEADLLSSDDLLGETPISEVDSGGGTISVFFTNDGANYRLTYRVDDEA